MTPKGFLIIIFITITTGQGLSHRLLSLIISDLPRSFKIKRNPKGHLNTKYMIQSVLVKWHQPIFSEAVNVITQRRTVSAMAELMVDLATGRATERRHPAKCRRVYRPRATETQQLTIPRRHFFTPAKPAYRMTYCCCCCCRADDVSSNITMHDRKSPTTDKHWAYVTLRVTDRSWLNPLRTII